MNKTVKELEQEIEALQKELEEAKKQKWRSPAYKWFIHYDLEAASTEFYAIEKLKWKLAGKGNTFETKEIAEAYAKELKNLFLINAWIREENKRTGWVADWENSRDLKCVVEFNTESKRFDYISAHSHKIYGVEATQRASAQELCELLNSGMIEGIEL